MSKVNPVDGITIFEESVLGHWLVGPTNSFRINRMSTRSEAAVCSTTDSRPLQLLLRES